MLGLVQRPVLEVRLQLLFTFHNDLGHLDKFVMRLKLSIFLNPGVVLAILGGTVSVLVRRSKIRFSVSRDWFLGRLDKLPSDSFPEREVSSESPGFGDLSRRPLVRSEFIGVDTSAHSCEEERIPLFDSLRIKLFVTSCEIVCLS